MNRTKLLKRAEDYYKESVKNINLFFDFAEKWKLNFDGSAQNNQIEYKGHAYALSQYSFVLLTMSFRAVHPKIKPQLLAVEFSRTGDKIREV